MSSVAMRSALKGAETACVLDVAVLWRPLVAALAMGLAAHDTMRRWSQRFEVPWIDAGRVVAAVMQLESVRDRTEDRCVGEAMRRAGLAVRHERAVAFRVRGSLPYPARAKRRDALGDGAILIDASPEALLIVRRAARSHGSTSERITVASPATVVAGAECPGMPRPLAAVNVAGLWRMRWRLPKRIAPPSPAFPVGDAPSARLRSLVAACDGARRASVGSSDRRRGERVAVLAPARPVRCAQSASANRSVACGHFAEIHKVDTTCAAVCRGL